MHKPIFGFAEPCRCKIPGRLLLSVWFAGLSLGFYAARFHGEMLASVLLRCAREGGSVSGTLSTVLLPLLLSAFAALIDRRLIYPVSALHGLGLGLMLGAVSGCCPGGGLLGALLLFSALCSCPVLMLYWQRRLRFSGGILRDGLGALPLLMGFWALDQWVIAPFLGRVMNF